MNYFSALVEQSLSRAKESTLSVLGITNPNLREHLQEQMQRKCGDEGSFLASPLFEHTFGWTQAEPTLQNLTTEKLLSKAVLASLDKENIIDSKGDVVTNRYQFKSIYHPYTHQLKSWQTLLSDDVKSIVVTSGTGSGKTECFMVPVLEDLYREQQQKQEKLVGIRAIFLYPLNALINSQRERLSAWTQDFGTDIRFCLYNGNTVNNENKVRAKQAKVPNEILSRELMRREPAPILVTNGTMLEYMLVRNVDSPIINKSKAEKSLRWIILDEAHTYVGSQAAELSMQLRRVLQAFGVEAKNVRFVATSATIAGEGAESQLQNFLAELAGVPTSQVVVIGGQRAIPEVDYNITNRLTYDELTAIPADETLKTKDFDVDVSSKRFAELSASVIAKTIREKFVSRQKPIKLTDLVEYLNGVFPEQTFDQTSVLNWIDLLTGTKVNKQAQAFLKVRAHFFQRMLNGLWSCIDPNCTEKASTVLKDNWPFGNVFVTQKSRCGCGAHVCEVGFCNDCNEPHLLAVEKNHAIGQRETIVSDEFSLLVDVDDEDESEDKVRGVNKIHYSTPITLRAESSKEGSYIPIGINKTTGIIGGFDEGINLYLHQDYENECGKCTYKGYAGKKPIRRAILGAPFYVTNAVPTLLEFCPDAEVINGIGPNSLPGRGRKLITFTDSRQGTARMAVKMQQEAEKSKLRGLVFEILKKKQLLCPQQDSLDDDINIDDLKKLADQLRVMMPAKAAEIDAEISAKLSGGISLKLVNISWEEMLTELILKEDINTNILQYNKYANQEIFGTDTGKRKVADMLLTREFIRRPKVYHNLETQGLVKLTYNNLEKITELPDNWATKDLTLQDWQNFLKVCLDFYIRDNSYFKLDDDWRQWIGFKFASKTLISPTSDDSNENRVKKWPSIKKNVANRLGKLLALGANLKLDNETDIQLINDWLVKAWSHLTNSKYNLLSNDNGKFYLDRRNISFSLMCEGFLCPSTNKVLDTTFKGVTPYLPTYLKDFDLKKYTCTSIKLPQLWDAFEETGNFQTDLSKVRDFINSNAEIKKLRELNLWTDINDRVLEGGFYYRTAEHSAQQSADRLQKYEDDFKKGKVNVLNCSTTMEMGVDIGGISAVVMNNVPPHPANYLQRSGRAGRSNESRAISYTLCKSNPHDIEVFNNPAWPFITKIPAPQISLDSSRLVSRHVNSLLLSIYLREVIGSTDKEKTALNLQWFYEAEDEEQSTCDKFKAWLASSLVTLEDTVKSLIRGTALAGDDISAVINRSKIAIEVLQGKWLSQLEYLIKSYANAEKDSPYEYRVSLELSRHRKEYLLKELAAKAFLPGYGFPTDVVTLNNSNIVDFRRDKSGTKSKTKYREDNISQLREMPSRNLAVAIREYAPGAQLVIDGRVFKSAGISLNWQKIGVNAKEAQKFDNAWKCDNCGQTGVEKTGIDPTELICSRCDQNIPLKLIKKTIEPTGFVTDFFEHPGNDISSQSYVPVEPGWLSLQGDDFPLPNPIIGFMSYGSNATLFQHSSGEKGKGYAVCLSCGKAESMGIDGEYPKGLSPNSDHRPITSTPKSKDSDGYQPPCDGSATVHSEIHIGCTSVTDAFELTLKHPISGEYIEDTDNGRTIALTLAVSLRNALASKLGISTSEIGYSVRPSRILTTNLPAMVIQLFDDVSGGAGFSTSAANHIDKLLTDMYDSLECDSCCESVCSTCLLDSNTRHDINHLDRHLALNWLSRDFKCFVSLAAEYNYLQGSKYCHESVKEAISHQINRGAKSVTLWLSDNLHEWDLNVREVHMFIYQLLQVNKVNLCLVVPNISLGESEKSSLSRFEELGVKLVTTNKALSNGFMVAITESATCITSIASQEQEILSPNESWLVSNCEQILVKSINEQGFEFMSLDTSQWCIKSSENGKKIELNTELNGDIQTFGRRFWDYIGNEFPLLSVDLKNNILTSVEYSDRYLQSPWYMVLLGEIIRGLPFNSKTSFNLQTLFTEKQAKGRFINHDWHNPTDMSEVLSLWFKEGIKLTCFLDLHESKSEISHRRELTLSFENGNSYSIGFDQGVGYWNHVLGRNKHYFDFSSEVNGQLMKMVEAWSEGKVKNSADWKTVMYINKL
jgi:DEAD/DEAH box helicase domain-containing protein